MTSGRHAEKVIATLHVDFGADLIQAVLKIVDIAVVRDKYVHVTGDGGGKNVVIVGISGARDGAGIPVRHLGFGKFVVDEIAPTFDLSLGGVRVIAA